MANRRIRIERPVTSVHLPRNERAAVLGCLNLIERATVALAVMVGRREPMEHKAYADLRRRTKTTKTVKRGGAA